MIDLARGHPSIDLLATKEVAAASATVYARLAQSTDEFDEEDRHPLQYGTDAGPLSARRTFASWFTRMYDIPEVDPELLVITCGASMGLGNTCLQLTDPAYTRRIFMITPAYFLAAKIFQDAGYGDKMYAIDEAASDGFDVNQLREVLENDMQETDKWPQSTTMEGKRYRYLFYGVPSFSNPSGIVWSIEKRKALLDIARRHDMLIITDEVYDFLDYGTSSTPIPRLVDLDLQTISSSPVTESWGNTISNMSFSKYLGPGLRIGAVQSATRQLIKQWGSGGANHSGGTMAQHTSYYISELIANGSIDLITKRLREVYAERSRSMLSALKRELPAGTQVFGGQGGYFIWVQLPETHLKKMTAADILAIAMTPAYGVRALSGAAFEVPGHVRGWGRSFLRLSLSFMETDKAVEGIRSLGRAVRACQELQDQR